MTERMQMELRRPNEGPGLENSDWCVGDAAGRWDVSFTDRLWGTFRRWFGGEGERVVEQRTGEMRVGDSRAEILELVKHPDAARKRAG